MQHHIWTPKEDERLIELASTFSQRQLAQKLSDEFGFVFTRNAVRHRVDLLNQRQHEKPDATQPPDPIDGYKETVEISHDGTHKSDKLLRMSAEQSKDVDYLLKAHGYDKNAWELVSARSNIWNSYSKQDGIMTLYASKITVKPKENNINWDDLIKQIHKVPKVTVVSQYIPSGECYLNVPLFDMHFGISSYDYYKPTQAKILNILKTSYKEVLIIFGQDAFHNDDMRGRTSSGREIEKVDMVQAWKDASLFYEPIINEALKNSMHVKIMFSKGNHSESMEWAFVQYLKARFPQCDFDDEFRERKVHMLGLNFCGVNHGDKKDEQSLPENFATEFPMEWSRAKTRTVFTGHRHSERVIDKGGVVIRRMPTRNKVDDWHDDKGYTTAHSRFQVHEYSYDEELRIHYV